METDFQKIKKKFINSILLTKKAENYLFFRLRLCYIHE